MENSTGEIETFSLVKRAKSFTHAGRGVWIFFKTTHNARIQTAVLAIVILLGVYFGVSFIDWMLMTFAGGFVLMAEAFNTAIEIDINLTSPQYHPYARDTKDVAAGAVLISVVLTIIVVFTIFEPKVIALIQKI